MEARSSHSVTHSNTSAPLGYSDNVPFHFSPAVLDFGLDRALLVVLASGRGSCSADQAEVRKRRRRPLALYSGHWGSWPAMIATTWSTVGTSPVHGGCSAPASA